MLILLLSPPNPPKKIPLLRRSWVQMLSTLVSRGPRFLGLAVCAAGGHSSAWGRRHVKGGGGHQQWKRSLPATEEGGGRPGTLWFEPFALCGSLAASPRLFFLPQSLYWVEGSGFSWEEGEWQGGWERLAWVEDRDSRSSDGRSLGCSRAQRKGEARKPWAGTGERGREELLRV